VWGERRTLVALAVAGATLALVILLGASRPHDARAASCSINVSTFSSGTLTVEGAGTCSDHAERFKVYCSGNALVDYSWSDDPLGPSGTHDSGAPCGDIQTLVVNGLNGNDQIEVGAVGSLRAIRGDAGGDTLLLRNGVSDTADCGADTDSIQADQHSLDSAANCEISDFLPEAAATTPTAKKKCKKKHRTAAAAKKCKKHKKR
jgi:hypothetical protein